MRPISFISFLLILFGCNSTDVKNFQFDGYSLDVPSKKIVLPSYLNEISGLAVLNDSTVLCMNDERGNVYALNINTEKLSLYFEANEKEDFEGIAIVNDTIVLLESDGDLYIQSKNSYKKIKYPFKKGSEFESLFNHNNKQLLFAVKKSKKKDERAFIKVFQYELVKSKFLKDTFLKWELPKDLKGFSPSALCFYENDFFILSGQSQQILKLNKTTFEFEVTDLPIELLPQAEGIARFNKLLIVSTEKNLISPAQILVYEKE